jgi:hypothetical protein
MNPAVDTARAATAGGWLILAAALLALAAYLYLTGRRFEIRLDIRFDDRPGRRPPLLEMALVAVSAVMVAVGLYFLPEGRSVKLRLALAASGVLLLFLAAWWLVAWVRETSAHRALLWRQWRSHTRRACRRLSAVTGEAALDREVCQRLAEGTEVSFAGVYKRREGAWRCQYATSPGHDGETWIWPGPPPDTEPHTGSVLLGPASDVMAVPCAPERGEERVFVLALGAHRHPFDAARRAFAERLVEHAELLLEASARKPQPAEPAPPPPAEPAEPAAPALDVTRVEGDLTRRALARLIAPELPEIQGLDYSLQYWRGGPPRGQFVDLMALPKGRLGIVLAEMDAEGVEAAVQMAQLQVLLRSRFQAYADDLRELMESTERALRAAATRSAPVKIFCACYSPAGATLTHVNAGYLPPILLRRSATGTEVQRLSITNAPLAGEPAAAFEALETHLMAGDILAGFSPGVIEAQAAGGAPWGEVRLIDLLMNFETQKASDLAQLILRGAEDYAGTPADGPDRTVLILKPARGERA